MKEKPKKKDRMAEENYDPKQDLCYGENEWENGYNQACDEWEAYHEQEMAKLRAENEDLKKRLEALPTEEELLTLYCTMTCPNKKYNSKNYTCSDICMGDGFIKAIAKRLGRG